MKELPTWRYGLRGAIEFGIFKTVAADHGFDFAGGIVDGDHGGLRSGLLFQLHASGGFAQILNGKLREIADGENFPGFFVPGPGEIGKGERIAR